MSTQHDRDSNVEYKTISVKVPEKMDELIEEQLTYGDTKSEHWRRAEAQRLEREGVVDDGEGLLP